MVAFYSKVDQDIYDQGIKFRPQQKYLLNEYKPPVSEVEKVQTTFGIPATNAFTGGGGGGANSYPGPYGNLVTDYQTTVDNRQNRLDNPSDTFLGFKTMKNRPATEASTTLAENIGIPQEMTMMGKVQDFFTPQSAQSIIDDGYQEPRFQPGIIGMLAGKIDNYRNLPQYDQAFIAQNMGYTGPTVFGENTSGLNKDPFGLNVRSAFGNYGERVGKEVTSLSEALGKSAGKRGLNFDASIGALVDASGNVIDEEDYDAKMLDFINQTKLMRTKLDFYRKKEIERNEIRKKEFDKPGGTGEQVAALNKRMQEEGVTGDKYDQAANIAGGGGGNTAKNAGGQTAREATYDNDPSTGTAQGYSQHYVRGGLVSIL